MTTLTFPFNFLLFDDKKERKTFVKKCTVQDFEEFLVNSDEQNYYLLDGQIIQMSNAGETHNDILLNFSDNIRSHIRQNALNCKFHFEMAIEFDNGNKFQTDFSVTCNNFKPAKHPIIVGEVFSKSTKKEDLEKKLPIYQAQSSIQEICYIEQKKKQIILFVRDKVNKNDWHKKVYDDNQIFYFESIGLSLSLDDIYRDVELSNQ